MPCMSALVSTTRGVVLMLFHWHASARRLPHTYLGLTGATLGAKVETASSYASAIWTVGNGLNSPAGAGSFKTNRLAQSLTCRQIFRQMEHCFGDN
jgi:hypothetical protein